MSTPSIPSATFTVDRMMDSVLFQVFPLRGSEVDEAILLRAFNPVFDLMAAEEKGRVGFVVGDVVELKPAVDEFYLRFTGNHLVRFVYVNQSFFGMMEPDSIAEPAQILVNYQFWRVIRRNLVPIPKSFLSI